jgi:hypothetical protein
LEVEMQPIMPPLQHGKQVWVSPYDPASLVANPNFVSSTNLRINSGVNLRPVPVSPLVTDDIDNLNRCGMTDVGADHHPAGLDAGVTAITSPASGVASPGLQDVKVLLTNIGSTTSDFCQCIL